MSQNFYSLLINQERSLPFARRDTAVRQILFLNDPLSTGCVENNITDEYDKEASAIMQMLVCGFPLYYSVKTVFDAFFWDDCLKEDQLNTICNSLTKLSLSL